MRRHIALSITIQAQIVGGDEYIPDSTAAHEDVVITLPVVDSKFFVFPKVIEGVTQSVVSQLRDNVSAYFDKKRADEKRRKEFEQMKLTYPDADPDQLDSVEGDESPFDDDATDDAEADGDSGDLDQDQGDDADGNDDDTVELTPAGIDFIRIQQEAQAALQADGVDVRVASVPAALDN